ncbi:LysR family transcriptional regulator [Humibacillus xanthopallidus]|uniref:DNA-binding transcriptional LysR family regulator n=1 Tax=Humibacillus xanthopallidus TaxID=412689 RepID=A0A543I295_9MICO|nr:LysR family transcriptional regulator [Humibacillus xanthopallidus]TQM64706.1 DNA-binding transcriptional LysR family regulator [Humibacillus xanthopallidus]
MDVDLRHLRAFVAVGQQLSFTRAAQELLVTQPALTRTVQQLEAALQVSLLERSSRHVSLTPRGARFLTQAQLALAAVDSALASVREHVTVRLGFSWLLPDPWAQRAVSSYEAATGNSVSLLRVEDPVAAVARGQVDVAVVRGTPAAQAGVRLVHLCDEVRVAVCSVESPLADADQLDWRDLSQWPLVVNIVSGTTGPWSWPDGSGPTRFVETRNFDEWLETVAANRGVGVVPEVAMRRNLHPAVRFIPLRGAPTSPVALAFRPDHQPALLRRFVETALAAAPRRGGQ